MDERQQRKMMSDQYLEQQQPNLRVLCSCIIEAFLMKLSILHSKIKSSNGRQLKI